MERRKFINISTASMVLLTTGAFALNNDDNQKLMLETESLNGIWNHESLIRIGNLYRDRYPNENYSKCLLDDVPDRFINDDGLPKYFRKKIIDEHKTNDTVLIDGWLISKTEGRKSALISIKYS